jgi:DNA polymerase III delta prime subunit
MSNSIENIYKFYKNQQTQLKNLDTIKEWFVQLEIVKEERLNKEKHQSLDVIETHPLNSTSKSKTKPPKSTVKKQKPKEHANVLLITGNTGVGKCLSRDTNVLVLDGTYKPIKLIEPEEYLLDPLGIPRKVHRICHGVSDMYYNIIYKYSINCFSYKVTKNHLLVLRNTVDNTINYCYPQEFLNSPLQERLAYVGIDINGLEYTVHIEAVYKEFEYVGITVENEIFVIDNGIITHNSDLVSTFLKSCTYDILDMGKLLDIYESTNIYSIKDFIPKLLKQKNVSDVTNKKLLVIDSLEESFVVQKTILRDVIENLEFLDMPLVIVSETNSFDNLEKKVLAKLKKDCRIVELEKPNRETLEEYIMNDVSVNNSFINSETVEKMIDMCNGDLRYLKNMLHFYKLELSEVSKSINIENIKGQKRDFIMDTESSLLEFSEGIIDEVFIRTEMDPFVFGMLTYENYVNCQNKPGYSKKNIINSICYADYLEKKLFKYQQWDLLEAYTFCSTIYPWKQLERPTKIQSSCTLQKYMNTKKKNRKPVLDF